MTYRTNIPSDVWKKIDIKGKNECWNWMGCSCSGYGKILIHTKVYLVHRLVYELIYGFIQEGMYILHKCNNPLCCNPKHLFMGTQQDNMNQMINDGHSNRGEKNSQSKLTEIDVLEIRRLYSTEEYTQKELGKIFEISRRHIGRIINKEKWGWL